MTFKIHKKLEVSSSLSQTWEFFSNPNNLKEITPPSLNMEITSSINSPIYPGMIITYRVCPLLSIPMTWVTEITHVTKGQIFVDEQRYGPYRMWHHQHRFQETSTGTLVEDIVDYILPFGPIGKAMHQLFIEKQLEQIFDYRTNYLIEKFGATVITTETVV